MYDIPFYRCTHDPLTHCINENPVFLFSKINVHPHQDIIYLRVLFLFYTELRQTNVKVKSCALVVYQIQNEIYEHIYKRKKY